MSQIVELTRPRVVVVQDGEIRIITVGSIGGTQALPGGDNTDVQFNDNGGFGGQAGFTFDKTTDTLYVDGQVNINATGNAASNQVPLVVGQTHNATANLQQWRDWQGTVLAFINRFGAAGFPGLTINSAYAFPTADGTAYAVLTTDGAGVVSWRTIDQPMLPADAVFATLTWTIAVGGSTSITDLSANTISATTVSANGLSGNGSAITGIDAGNISAGVLPIVRGGTGQTSANSAFNALAPSQSGASGKFLKTDATNTSWASLTTSDVSGCGTVTSVSATVPSFLSVSGSPITTSGTLAITLSGTALPLANGGTGATTQAGAITAVAPPTSGHSGQFLTNDGAGNITWGSVSGANGGTVTSVAMTVPAFLSVSGTPITGAGTLALTLSGTALPIANGGTGNTTANSSFNALAPSQSSASGKFLKSNGTDTSWATISQSDVSGAGTVSSVAMTVPSILSISGSPITTSGTLAVSLANESANTIFAGPSTGSAAAPTFRAMVNADYTTTIKNFDSINSCNSSGHTFPLPISFALAVGTAATTGSNKTVAAIVPRAGTITKAFIYAKTGPTTSALICDVNLNGTSIWNSTQSNRIQIAAGSQSGNQTSFDTTTVAEGDVFTIDIDQIGSGTAGQDITVEILLLTKNA